MASFMHVKSDQPSQCLLSLSAYRVAVKDGRVDWAGYDDATINVVCDLTLGGLTDAVLEEVLVTCVRPRQVVWLVTTPGTVAPDVPALTAALSAHQERRRQDFRSMMAQSNLR